MVRKIHIRHMLCCFEKSLVQSVYLQAIPTQNRKIGNTENVQTVILVVTNLVYCSLQLYANIFYQPLIFHQLETDCVKQI